MTVIIGENANDKLSRLASAVQREAQELCAGLQERKLFHAPSECDALIVNGTAKRVRQLLKAAGLTPREFDQLMKSRVSDKWLHFHWKDAQSLCGEEYEPDCLPPQEYRERYCPPDFEQVMGELQAVDPAFQLEV